MAVLQPQLTAYSWVVGSGNSRVKGVSLAGYSFAVSSDYSRDLNLCSQVVAV